MYSFKLKVHIYTIYYPCVQRARSLKEAEKQSESQRNPESLRNLSESFSESESFRARQFGVLMHLGYIQL